MFYQSQPIVAGHEWAEQPERGDVVLFRFPIAEEAHEPDAPKRRPCLILDVFDWKGGPFVELAYGTSADTRANRGYEVLVKQPGARAVAGLTKPTRFVCARRIIVHVNHSGFQASEEACAPLIGRLDAALLERMHAVRARIQAEVDIAAYEREERRREAETHDDHGFQ